MFIISHQAFAIKGEYVSDRDLASTCKLTFFVMKDGKEAKGTCTGSFIGNKTFIGAEHCMDLIALDELNRYPYFTCPGSEQRYTIKKSLPMKNSGITELQDIRIFKVEEEVNVPPISLTNTKDELEMALQNPEKCFISGYGLDNNQEYGQLKTARLKEVENWPLDIFSSGSKYRVRLRKNYADKGDSGGPLYCETVEGLKLIGVVHGGLIGGQFSDIEKLNQTLDWIKFHLNHNDGNEEEFKKLGRILEMCHPLEKCTEAMRKLSALTEDTEKIISQLIQDSQKIKILVLAGHDPIELSIQEVWDQMIHEWERNNCFEKLYP